MPYIPKFRLKSRLGAFFFEMVIENYGKHFYYEIRFIVKSTFGRRKKLFQFKMIIKTEKRKLAAALQHFIKGKQKPLQHICQKETQEQHENH